MPDPTHADGTLPRATAPLPPTSQATRLAIADPPYPPFIGSGGVKPRATRWYGTGQRSKKDRPGDVHPEASEWDDPARHQRLLSDLLDGYDGFAIATAPDGIAAYGILPYAMRIMVWVKPNASPGSHRLRSLWEAVLLYPPIGRRSNRNGAGMVPDVLTADAPRRGFPGAKPPEWTWWVLDALSYAEGDEVVDLFPGSGLVGSALRSPRLIEEKGWLRGLAGEPLPTKGTPLGTCEVGTHKSPAALSHKEPHPWDWRSCSRWNPVETPTGRTE